MLCVSDTKPIRSANYKEYSFQSRTKNCLRFYCKFPYWMACRVLDWKWFVGSLPADQGHLNNSVQGKVVGTRKGFSSTDLLVSPITSFILCSLLARMRCWRRSRRSSAADMGIFGLSKIKMIVKIIAKRPRLSILFLRWWRFVVGKKTQDKDCIDFPEEYVAECKI